VDPPLCVVYSEVSAAWWDSQTRHARRSFYLITKYTLTMCTRRDWDIQHTHRQRQTDREWERERERERERDLDWFILADSLLLLLTVRHKPSSSLLINDHFLQKQEILTVVFGLFIAEPARKMRSIYFLLIVLSASVMFSILPSIRFQGMQSDPPNTLMVPDYNPVHTQKLLVSF